MLPSFVIDSPRLSEVSAFTPARHASEFGFVEVSLLCRCSLKAAKLFRYFVVNLLSVGMAQL